MKIIAFFVALLVSTSAFGGISVSPPISAGGIAAAGGVTNEVHWTIFTNNTAYGNGKWYLFPNSKTACISEIQALSPLNLNGTSGLRIDVQPGDYFISSPLQFSNNCVVQGAGYTSTRFIYVGNTNISTLSSMMSKLQYNVSGSYTNWDIGIVELVSQGPNAPGNYFNFDFRDLSFQVSTDFPCALIAGNANNLMLKNVGLFGPNVFSSIMSGSSVAPGSYPGGPLSAIGCVANVNSTYDLDGCEFIELADGALVVGNSWFTTEKSWFFFCGDINGPPVNNYPTTNWLSVGIGLYLSKELTFGAKVMDISPLQNYLDIWVDGCAASIWNPFWQGSNFAIGVSQNAKAFSFANGVLNGGTDFSGVYLSAGSWTVGGIFSTNGAISRLQPNPTGFILSANGQSVQNFIFTTNGISDLNGYVSLSYLGYQNMTAAPTSNDFVTAFGPIASHTTTNHITRTVNGALTDYWTTNGATISNKQLAP